MQLIQQSEGTAAEREVRITLYDPITGDPKTGLSPTVTICKAGGSSFGAIAGSVAEIGSTGCYKVALAAGDVDTLGAATLRVSADGVEDMDVHVQVVDFIAGVAHADIVYAVNDSASQDEYTVQFYWDGVAVDPGSATLTVWRRDGTKLIDGEAMTGVESWFIYDATGGERAAAGDALEVQVQATIGGAVRTVKRVFGRDVQAA